MINKMISEIKKINKIKFYAHNYENYMIYEFTRKLNKKI